MSSFAWGLVGPGRIAHKFAQVVQQRPGLHLAAVCGRDRGRAQAFASQWARPDRPVPRADDRLQSMLDDPAIDAVYVATPHAQHAEAVEACLRAGKPVLCEKPLVATRAQALRVLALARERRVFLMEALWTRFLPVYDAVGEILAGGRLGAVQHLQSSFCFPAPLDPDGRLYNPALAGGALLDVGIYNLAMSRWALARATGACPPIARLEAVGRRAPTGVDARVAATLVFEGGAVAQFVCAFDGLGENALSIQGERGRIRIAAPFWGATDAQVELEGEPAQLLHRPHAINGFEYPVEEAVRCIRAGLTESPGMPAAESLALADGLQALREQVGVRYPFNEPAP